MSGVSEREKPSADLNEASRSYWATHCPSKTRGALMVVLVSCFLLQTAFVYRDPSVAARETARPAQTNALQFSDPGSPLVRATRINRSRSKS